LIGAAALYTRLRLRLGVGHGRVSTRNIGGISVLFVNAAFIVLFVMALPS
jgi:hypothetical protein